MKSGTVSAFNLSPADRVDKFAIRFFGDINISTGGNYTFYLTSDDGSRLWIDGNPVVNNDGLHGSAEQSGSITLLPGAHMIEVAFFEMYGDETLIVEIEGPGISRQAIPDSMLTYRTTGGSESGNGSENPEDRYTSLGSNQSVSIVQFQPDNWIGAKMNRQKGDNKYNTNGASQTARLDFRRPRPAYVYFTLENDRTVPDDVKILASSGGRKFVVNYYQLTGGPRNVTGKISGTSLYLPAVEPGEQIRFKAKCKPSRSILRRRGTDRVSIMSSSTFDGLGSDKVKAILKKK